jgi:catechol 2,3-dioxygenase-like lactoylglutathione lyase family enzyme
MEKIMAPAALEHVNVTVSDPEKTAQRLCELFGWKIRWQGSAIHGGFTVHVGAEDSYLAVYSKDKPGDPAAESYFTRGGLNHIGITVSDLDTVEAKVKAMGYAPYNHADYEPGRRFYFDDEDGIEFEVVSYE